MIRAITPFNFYKNQSSFGINAGTVMQNKFNSSDKDFNPTQAKIDITRKYSRYPFVIKGIVFLVSEYIAGLTDKQTFSKNYLDRTPVLLQRIEYSKDKQQFEDTYSKEIGIIKSLNKVCDKYNKGEIGNKGFDLAVETHAKDFLSVKPTEHHIFSA